MKDTNSTVGENGLEVVGVAKTGRVSDLTLAIGRDGRGQAIPGAHREVGESLSGGKAGEGNNSSRVLHFDVERVIDLGGLVRLV